MSQKPQPTGTHRGIVIVNPRHSAAAAKARQGPKVHRFRHYGKPEHMRWVMDFQAKDARAKNTQANRYGRTVTAFMAKWGGSESTAKKAIASVAAYRSDVFHAELPGKAMELVEHWHRIAAKAEADKDYSGATGALREVGRVMGIYSPIKVDVTHHEGPSVEEQLRQVMAVLSPEGQAAATVFLAEVEAAKKSGRLQLTAGQDEAPADDDDDAEDAEFVET